MCHRTGQSRTLSNVRMNMVYVMAANPCDVKLCRHAHPSTCRWHFPKWVSRLQNALHSFFYNWLSLSQKNPTRMTRMSWIPAIICSDSCSGIGCGNNKKWDILNVFSCSLHISNPFFYQQWYHQTCTSLSHPVEVQLGHCFPFNYISKTHFCLNGGNKRIWRVDFRHPVPLNHVRPWILFRSSCCPWMFGKLEQS